MSESLKSNSSADTQSDHISTINSELSLGSVSINEESDDNMSLFSDSSYCPLTYYTRDTLSSTVTHVEVHIYETSLDRGAFMNYVKLTHLHFPDGLLKISDFACSGCVSLEKVIIPPSVIEIGQRAFCRCRLLKEVVFSEGLKFIKKDAFRRCKSLEAITIPHTVSVLGDGAFSLCTSLKTVVLPNGLESIDSYAFAFCESIDEIKIPTSVTNLGYRSFEECIKLKNVVLSEGLQRIGGYAFANCSSLERLAIPSSVIVIGEYVCDSLSSIHFSQEVEEFISTNYIPWWNCISYYEYHLNYSEYQSKVNMFEDTVITYCRLRSFNIIPRWKSLKAQRWRRDILQLLCDVPKRKSVLNDYFSDIHDQMCYYEHIQEGFNLLILALWRASIIDWEEHNPKCSIADTSTIYSDCLITAFRSFHIMLPHIRLFLFV